MKMRTVPIYDVRSCVAVAASALAAAAPSYAQAGYLYAFTGSAGKTQGTPFGLISLLSPSRRPTCLGETSDI